MRLPLGFALILVTAAGCSRVPDNGNQFVSADPLPPANSSVAPPQPAPRAARDGPFGLAMGQPLTELDFAESDRSDTAEARILSSVPRPMNELETYAVVGYPETGICEIRSVSRAFESDAYGNNVRAAMDSLADALDSRYGTHRLTNQCSDYSCQFFQQNLREGSQTYSYRWSRETGATLPRDIGEISLVAMPGDFNGTFFRLDYESANREACQSAQRRARASAL